MLRSQSPSLPFPFPPTTQTAISRCCAFERPLHSLPFLFPLTAPPPPPLSLYPSRPAGALRPQAPAGKERAYSQGAERSSGRPDLAAALSSQRPLGRFRVSGSRMAKVTKAIKKFQQRKAKQQRGPKAGVSKGKVKARHGRGASNSKRGGPSKGAGSRDDKWSEKKGV